MNATNKVIPYLFLSVMILLSVLAQVFLKNAGLMMNEQEGVIEKFLLNPWLISALLFYGGSWMCWVLVLKSIPLARAYSYTALTYVVIALIDHQFFNHHINLTNWLGIALILIGISITTRSVCE